MVEEILLKMESGEEITEQEKKKLYKAMANIDETGDRLRRDFALSRSRVLAPVIRQESIIRQIFVETDTDGENVPYPVRGEKVKYAFFTSSLGGTPQRTIEEDEIYVPTFFIRAGARWKIDLLKAANTRLIENMEDDAVDSVVLQENVAGWKLVKAAEAAGAITSVPQPTTDKDRMSIEVMVEILTHMDEKEDRRKITDIYLSPRRYNELLKWCKLNVEELPDGTRREVFDRGPDAVANILRSWNVAFHKVFDPRFADDTKCYCFANSFGVMSLDIPWETLNDDMAKMVWEAGWIGREKAGFAILDAPASCVYTF